jgi:inner membrane protein
VPTIVTHPAVALLRTWWPRLSRRVVVAGAIATVLPDADVVSFALGIPYDHPFGHRGFTHSILFAAIVAAIAARLLATRGERGRAFAFLFLCAVSHPILDAMTNGGLGVAFFAPLSNARSFFPWTPIRVSPIGARFFSVRGLATLQSEVVTVWLPLAVASVAPLLFRHRSD